MARFNLKNLYRGDTVSLEVTVTKDGDAFSLSGSTLFFTLKTDPTAADDAALVALETGSGITVTNAAAGEALIEMAPSDTDDLPLDTALFADVQLKTATGDIFTVAFGTLTFTTDVTKRTS